MPNARVGPVCGLSRDENLAAADFLLSIVPPGAALGLAERLAPVLGRAPTQAGLCRLQRREPAHGGKVTAAVVDGAGCKFLDAGMDWRPARARAARVRGCNASGPDARRLADLTVHGWTSAPWMAGAGLLPPPAKMSYAGITKGFTALGAVMMLAATRAGTAEALRRELADSQPTCWSAHAGGPGDAREGLPLGGRDGGDSRVRRRRPGRCDDIRRAARFYEGIAADADGPETERVALTAFCNRPEASA